MKHLDTALCCFGIGFAVVAYTQNDISLLLIGALFVLAGVFWPIITKL
jgi:hypothetical protein